VLAERRVPTSEILTVHFWERAAEVVQPRGGQEPESETTAPLQAWLARNGASGQHDGGR
jgi:hypothetical protein